MARDGDDESVLCVRDGYHVEKLEGFRIASTTELAREIWRRYEMSEKKPEAIFIDSVGVGAGTYDRLCEFGLGQICREAKASYKATNEAKFANKRAEMYFALKEKFHLLTMSAHEKLKKQLQMIEFQYDRKERYLILPKDELKKEYGTSPDYADALALTFFDEVMSARRTEAKRQRYDGDFW